MSAVLDAAVRAMGRGWAVGPLHTPDPGQDSGCSCRRAGCSSPGKHPRTMAGVHDFTDARDAVVRWWRMWPGANLGVATGEVSGVFVIDLDAPDGVDTLIRLQKEHGQLPTTVTSRTGGGGYHLFFEVPTDTTIRNSASRVGPGVDVRGDGGFVVAPPSAHASGTPYQWVGGRSPDHVTPATPPNWLLELVRKDDGPFFGSRTPGRDPDLPETPADRARYVQRAIEYECQDVASTPEGQRNHRLNKAAFSLARFVAAGAAKPDPVVRALATAATEAGLPQSEIERTVQSAFRARGVA